MFAKIVTGLFLVSVLPCESKHQKFVEVPFDDGTLTRETQQFASQSPQVHSTLVRTVLDEKPHFAHIAPNQHFTSSEQQFHGNSHNNLMHNHHIINPIIETAKPRSNIINGEELLRNSALTVHLQDSGRSTFHENQDSDFPTVNQVSGFTRHVQAQAPEVHLTSFDGFSSSDGFARSRPIQSNVFGEVSPQPIRNNKFSHATVAMPSHSKQFDAPPSFGSNGQFDYQLPNSLAQSKTSKQPVNTFLGVEEPTFRFTALPAEKPENPSGDVSNIDHFIRQVQPAVRAPVSPPTRKILNSQLSQLNHREVSQNPRFPEQPKFFINAHPDMTTQTRFSVNQGAPATHEVLRGPNLNLVQQNQNEQQLEEEVFRKQAESARYSFASQIDDSINGNQHQREETRDGLSVKGMYSYSDGYVKRTVFYEADENGYRVVKEEEEPLGNGPQVNPKGQANVSSYVAGNAVQYSITADDIQENKDIGVEGRRIQI